MLELVELNMNMGEKEYQMYQDIPLKESGSTNLCNGLPYSVFKNFLGTQMARKYNGVSLYDTPVIIYIMYYDGVPVGYIGLRTEIDDNWMKWSGNVFYVIRESFRGKGYGNKILELGLNEFKKMNYKEIYCQSSAGNVYSAKKNEKNGGILINEIEGTRYYKIVF